MRLAIEELVASKPTPEKISAFLGAHKFPLIEGVSCTFVFRGEADAVNVRHWVYGLEASNICTRVPGTDLWYLVLEIPRRSRVEYKLEVSANNVGRWIEDPLNPNRARDPFGANSVVHGEGYVVPEWTAPDPDARPGTLDPWTIKSKAFNDARSFNVYLPARYRKTRRYPLIWVHDGPDYVRFANLKTVLDNLIHRLEIPDVIAVFTDSPDRLREYAADAGHARYITEELLPDIARRYPLHDNAQSRCLMGASFGGVASLSTACLARAQWAYSTSSQCGHCSRLSAST